MPQAFKDLLDFKSDKIALKGRAGQFCGRQNIETGEPGEFGRISLASHDVRDRGSIRRAERDF